MDRDRLERFVREDYPRVVAAVGFACGDSAMAEDAVQDVLAKALGHQRSVDDLRGWVVVSAMNRVRSGQRRRGAERRAVDRLEEFDPSGLIEPSSAPSSSGSCARRMGIGVEIHICTLLGLTPPSAECCIDVMKTAEPAPSRRARNPRSGSTTAHRRSCDGDPTVPFS